MLKVRHRVLVQRLGISERACPRTILVVPESRHAHASRSEKGDGARSLSQRATIDG
jgi:hypothetical protein